jgi:hypothetical protein
MLNRDRAADFGLGYALADGCAAASVNGRGPGGKSGVCACKTAEKFGYHPDQQTWIRIHNPAVTTPVFVGYWNDSPPTPAELAKPAILEGWPVRLMDGGDWIAPAAYRWFDDGDEPPKWSYALPAHAEIDDSGAWTRGRVRKDYARLWDIAKTHFDLLVGAASDESPTTDIELSAKDTRDLAAEVLGVNYRVSKWECALLGLFDDPPTMAAQVLRATIGFPALEAWQKKRTLAVVGGSNGNAGAAA